MEDLSTLRQGIDGIDRQITKLLEERMDFCNQVASYKIANNLPVLDAKREESLLAAKADLVSDPGKIQDIQSIFQAIMACSRNQQQGIMAKNGGKSILGNLVEKADWVTNLGENPAILYQGQPGAYGEEAAMNFFGKDCNRTNLKTWDGVFRGVRDGFGDFGVLPIENSSTGSITDVFDLLGKFGCYVVGEALVRVEHCLMAKKGTAMKDINAVYSHEQGLLQCRGFLSEYGKKWNQQEMANTALSAKFVAETQESGCAAIASRRAAELYDLDILQSRVNDRAHNYTRFVVVAARPVFLETADKISISFSVTHTKGSLYRVLEIFAKSGLNLLNLESRPVVEKNWEYRFFADLSGNLRDVAMDKVFCAVEEQTVELLILGNYEAVQ